MKYEEIPEKIKQQELQILNSTISLESFKLDLSNIEDMVYEQVENEKDEKGKKIYSNEDKRKKETKLRCLSDSNYCKLIDKIKETEIQIKTMNVERDYNRRMFRLFYSLKIEK